MSAALQTSTRDSSFASTRWTVVRQAADSQTASQHALSALSELCQIYWRPVYVFLRRQGIPQHDAQDLTQGFFAELIENRAYTRADPTKGRFRSFLLGTLKHFVAHARDYQRAQKRGGGAPFVPFDAGLAEQRYQQEGADALSPDRIYERQWAMTLLRQAMTRLRAEYAAAGKEAEFEKLKHFLTAERGAIPYAALATALGTSEGATRVAVHRLRKRFRKLFRATIADTVDNVAEVEDELRYVARVLGET